MLHFKLVLIIIEKVNIREWDFELLLNTMLPKQIQAKSNEGSKYNP